jgi:hypothetical protein
VIIIRMTLRRKNNLLIRPPDFPYEKNATGNMQNGTGRTNDMYCIHLMGGSGWPRGNLRHLMARFPGQYLIYANVTTRDIKEVGRKSMAA